VLALILKFMGLIAGKSLQCAAYSESVRHPKQGITLNGLDVAALITVSLKGVAKAVNKAVTKLVRR
jgi:hypothetical protein